ncbi:MAG TPA: G5 domain-containing protein [Candidatus Saccharimonadales bacterium]
MKSGHARKILISLLSLACILAPTSTVSAHRSGCHRWHSCPSDSGSYVCGDLGYTSECGTVTPAPVVHTPVYTTKTITADESLPFTTAVKYNKNEYPEYAKTIVSGESGVKRTYTEVKYTDGSETGRSVVRSEVVTKPVTEVIEKGSRPKPSATVSKVKKTTSKNQYDISGKSDPKVTVVLSVDGKRIKRTVTDAQGNFTFKNIKLKSPAPQIQIYKRVSGKETIISEKYTLNPSKQSIVSDYQKLHTKQ